MDLGQAQDIQNVRLIWEKANGAYKYRIEGSTDAKDWKLLVDQSKNKEVRHVTPQKVAAELPAKQIKKREKIPASSMPPGLVAGLTPEQLADLLAYLDNI